MDGLIYAEYIAQLHDLGDSWEPEPMRAALRAQMFLSALWMEALLATEQARASGIRLTLSPTATSQPGIRLDFLRHQHVTCWVAYFITPAETIRVKTGRHGPNVPARFDRTEVPPATLDWEQMRAAAQKEIKEALAMFIGV